MKAVDINGIDDKIKELDSLIKKNDEKQKELRL